MSGRPRRVPEGPGHGYGALPAYGAGASACAERPTGVAGGTYGGGAHMQGWFVLMVAIVFEIVGTTCMKLSDGFERVGPTIGLIVAYGISFGALTLAIKTVDVGVAYAVWSGLGTAAIAAIGMVMFGEPFSYLRVFWIGVIVAGVVGLQLSSVR